MSVMHCNYSGSGNHRLIVYLFSVILTKIHNILYITYYVWKFPSWISIWCFLKTQTHDTTHCFNSACHFRFSSEHRISSEDSGDAPSYIEDSDDSYSLELDIDSSHSGQMNLLEEILDSLNTTTLEQGKLSAAKSLDFFRSMDDLDYKAPVWKRGRLH